jgi:hypothetical protein
VTSRKGPPRPPVAPVEAAAVTAAMLVTSAV